MAEAAQIRFPLKAHTYETLIGLLASSGLRVGEALRLERLDVDLDNGLITIRESKFRKSSTIRRHLIAVPCRLARSARPLVLHLSRDRPWQDSWEGLFNAACEPPTPATT
jgi:integrase